jgi:hypothetical protein
MLRVIGGLVVIVLVLGPLLLQIGVLENAGLFRELIELEVKAFSMLIEFVRATINGHP